jgi:hypothetical protein
MLGSCSVAAQLAASQEGLSSINIVRYVPALILADSLCVPAKSSKDISGSTLYV